MNYCLEMDLMCSKRAREIYYMEKKYTSRTPNTKVYISKSKSNKRYKDNNENNG